MDLYETVERRRKTRGFLDKEVDFETIKRIFVIGNKSKLKTDIIKYKP